MFFFSSFSVYLFFCEVDLDETRFVVGICNLYTIKSNMGGISIQARTHTYILFLFMLNKKRQFIVHFEGQGENDYDHL